MTVMRDTWLILERQLLLLLRNLPYLLLGVTQPALYLLLFAPLLRTLLDVPSIAEAYRIFVPGMLVMLAIFGTLFAGFALLAEERAGVLDRCRVTPVSRVALLLGRSIREVVALLVQVTLVIAIAAPFGLAPSVRGIVVVYTLLGLTALAMSAFSYLAALRLNSEAALAPLLNTITQPLLLLSGILIPITAATAPGWLVYLARLNPVTWTVDAVRAQFTAEPGGVAVWAALATTGVLAVVAVLLAGRTLSRGLR